MNMRDTQILNARKRVSRDGTAHYYCNLITQVHVNCEHGNSLLSTEQPKPRSTVRKRATREEQHARYIDCGPANWDDR